MELASGWRTRWHHLSQCKIINMRKSRHWSRFTQLSKRQHNNKQKSWHNLNYLYIFQNTWRHENTLRNCNNIFSLCHKSSFNPCCNVHGFFFLKTSYVSLIYKCRIVLKIFTSPFLSYTLPQRGEISNISNRQTKSAWKYIITLLILLSQPYAPQETNIYKAGMLLCTRRVCIL